MSAFPFKFEDLDEETNEAIKKDFLGHTRGMIRIQPFGLCVPPEFKNCSEKIYNMEVRPDDVWLVTFPKSGTTWMSATIWSILNDGRLDLLQENPNRNNWRFLEFGAITKDGTERLIAEKSVPEHFVPMVRGWRNQLEQAIDDPRNVPRLIKTHLPFPMLPPNLLDTTKVVYVARNPRDTCVSFYHHHKSLLGHSFVGDFEMFFDYFLKDLILETPYWPHVVDAWNRRHHPNMLFMFYEDIKRDFANALKKLANFINKPISEELIEKLVKELSVEEMKKNPVLNFEIGKEMGIMAKEGSFIRKGIVGDWKSHFTPEMEKQMDKWSTRGRQGCDIKFPGEE